MTWNSSQGQYKWKYYFSPVTKFTSRATLNNDTSLPTKRKVKGLRSIFNKAFLVLWCDHNRNLAYLSHVNIKPNSDIQIKLQQNWYLGNPDSSRSLMVSLTAQHFVLQYLDRRWNIISRRVRVIWYVADVWFTASVICHHSQLILVTTLLVVTFKVATKQLNWLSYS